jgi:hypothetical protein
VTIIIKEGLEALAVRREANSKKEKINNSALHTGSPMYYYCHGCNAEQRLRETHLAGEIKQFCDECQELIEDGTVTADQLRKSNH